MAKKNSGERKDETLKHSEVVLEKMLVLAKRREKREEKREKKNDMDKRRTESYVG